MQTLGRNVQKKPCDTSKDERANETSGDERMAESRQFTRANNGRGKGQPNIVKEAYGFFFY